MTAPHCVCPASALLCSALLTLPRVWCHAITSFVVGRPPYNKSNFYLPGALNRVTASGNGVGIGASGAGVSLTLTDTVAGNNNYGIAASASAVMVRDSSVSNNAIGIVADRTAVVRVGQSTVTANGTGWRLPMAAKL
jgi:hypothetical protein